MKGDFWMEKHSSILKNKGLDATQRKKRLIKRLIAVIILLLLISGGLFLWLRPSGGPNIDPGSSKFNGGTSNTKAIAPGHTNIPGYDNIKMKADTNVAYVALWNPDGNKVYFQFSIILKSNNKTIYKSGLIPPGEAVKKVNLSTIIHQGVYPIKLKIDAYDLKDYTKKMNGGIIDTNIIGLKTGD